MSKHIYENKGVRLYYDIKSVSYLGARIEDLYYKLMSGKKASSEDINSILDEIDITTVDHEGGWKS